MSFSKFYRNFILCGEVDHHCLLCDETFHKLEDIEKHIRWEKHRKVMKSQICLHKFKNDGIFQIANDYYCSHCNYVIKNIATVKEHVGTEKHITNKTTPDEKNKIKFGYDSGNIIINKLKIDSKQWHTIFNKRCLMCNVDVDNILKHIETQDHIIRLIHTETILDGDEKCYRKVNEDIFQCFVCKKTFSSNSFDSHWQNDGHVKPPVGSHKTNGISERPIKIYDIAEYNKITEREYCIKKLVDIKDDFFKVDIKNNEIICKQCMTPIKNTKEDLTQHLYNIHKTYRTQKSNIITHIVNDIEKDYILVLERDHGKARHELAMYGKDNHIQLNAGGSKGYCTLCDRFLSSHIKIFKQHVNGAVHTGHLEIKEQLKPRKHKKGPTRSEILLRYLCKIEFIPEINSVAINTTFCIDKNSFLLMKRIEHGQHIKRTKCFACDETFEMIVERDHCETKAHKSIVMSAKVIHDKYNFIREIRPKLYHCGLCNITLPFWDILEKHISELSHKMKIPEKNYNWVNAQFQKQNGYYLCSETIEHNPNSDVLYSNLLDVLFSASTCC